MEPEFHLMSPVGVSVHTARMKLVDVTPEGLVEMAEDAERAASLLASAAVDIIVYGCTTGSLVGGIEWEEHLVEEIEGLTGLSTFSTSGAVVEALKVLDLERVAVATPYTEVLNRLERVFLEAHGFEVTAMKGLGLIRNLDIGATEAETIADLVKSIVDGADGIFISCTNLPTVNILEPLERELEMPIVSSNQASIWVALRDLGFGGMEGFGSLLRGQL
jgi:maleate isomerase